MDFRLLLLLLARVPTRERVIDCEKREDPRCAGFSRGREMTLNAGRRRVPEHSLASDETALE